jgi:cytochrome c6
MDQDKPHCDAVFACSMLLVLLTGLTLFVAPIASTNSAINSAATTATFRTKCAGCHGQDGGGSAAGKSMNVPDLRSPAVQNLTDAELAHIISDGKDAMPAFKDSLSEDQIHSLVTHIRSLRQQK